MDVFFSYRRDNGIELTRAIKITLNSMGYTTFFDNDSIGNGIFSEKILNNIQNSDNFVLILTPNALDRCSSENDWLRKEIEEALRLKKNIIPVFTPGFDENADIHDSVSGVLKYQGVKYDATKFDASVELLISYLRDKEGNSLRLKKKENIANLFYQNGMAEEEKIRIQYDYQVVEAVEVPIWNKLLKGKKDLVLFAPAIYETNTYIKKYQRSEFSHIYGLVNTTEECNLANSTYGNDNIQFYIGNMEHDNFEDEMDQIISNNNIKGFDFVDLTLILRDLSNPSKKLQQVVDRMNSGGIVYVREFDHSCAMAYPDDDNKFEYLLNLIKEDIYSGDFHAGRKVYSQMMDAYLDRITLVNTSISTVDLTRKQKGIMFEALFSYLPREYDAMLQRDPHNKKISDGCDWLKENYHSLKRTFIGDNFFYRSGYMFFYGYKN